MDLGIRGKTALVCAASKGLGKGCAAALGLILFAVALTRALVTDPDLVVPQADQAEQTSAHPVGPGEFAPDLAADAD